MKYMGIDFGSKHVGVAVSDDVGKIAFPRAEVKNDASLTDFITQMIDSEKVQHIVVGDTRSHGGAKNPITEEMEEFIGTLSLLVAVPIDLASEAWSSIEASRYAPKGKEHSNAAAAAIILQRFLDMRASRVK